MFSVFSLSMSIINLVAYVLIGDSKIFKVSKDPKVLSSVVHKNCEALIIQNINRSKQLVHLKIVCLKRSMGPIILLPS